MVKIKWTRLQTPLKPKDFLSDIEPLLPERYSPLKSNGNGNQGFYLTEISKELGYRLLYLIGDGEPKITWEFKDIDSEKVESEKIINDSTIPKTQREQLIQARIGQGLFRKNVEKLESHCRITDLADKRFLIASHIKPWKNSTNNERLDGHNGFLMSPHIDKLFDKGLISFSNKGKLLVSGKQIRSVLLIWSINPSKNLGGFTLEQKNYLEYHRDVIFKK